MVYSMAAVTIFHVVRVLLTHFLRIVNKNGLVECEQNLVEGKTSISFC